jgi:hypothetical protein
MISSIITLVMTDNENDMHVDKKAKLEGGVPLLTLPDVADKILEFVFEPLTLLRLSWTCRFFREKFADDEFWRRFFGNFDTDLLPPVKCEALRVVGGLTCRGLVMAWVAIGQKGHRLRSYEEVANCPDPRTMGIITFRPGRRCRADIASWAALDWCVMMAKRGACQILWRPRNGRADFLISYFAPWNRTVTFHVQGELVWLFRNKNNLVENLYQCIRGDSELANKDRCTYIRVDPSAPNDYLWMNSDRRLNLDHHHEVLERVTRRDLKQLMISRSEITVGGERDEESEGGGVREYHYGPSQPGSRGHNINPDVQYALHQRFKNLLTYDQIFEEMHDTTYAGARFLGIPNQIDG